MFSAEVLSRIAVRETPLFIARVALDKVYSEQEQDVLKRLRQGERLGDLMSEPYQDPRELWANETLKRYRPSESNTSTYTDWFQVMTTLWAAKPQRLFLAAALRKPDYIEERTKLKTDAYKSYGGLLRKALDVLGSTGHAADGYRELTGAMSELTVLTAPNGSTEDGVACSQSRGVDDQRFGIDAHYFYPDEYDGASRHAVLQVTTSEKSADEKPELEWPDPVLPVIYDEFFAIKGQHRRIGARLVAQDSAQELSPPRRRLVTSMINELDEHVRTNHDIVLMNSDPL